LASSAKSSSNALTCALTVRTVSGKELSSHDTPLANISTINHDTILLQHASILIAFASISLVLNHDPICAHA
jgi:hypothetical protein